MSTTWHVEGTWWTGHVFDTERGTYEDALKDYRLFRRNRAVKALKLVREDTRRSVIRRTKKTKYGEQP